MLFAYRGTTHVLMMPMFVQWGDGAPTANPPQSHEPKSEDARPPETEDIPGDGAEGEAEANPEPKKPKGRRKKNS